MQTLIKSKGILAAIAIFIVVMFLYNLFFRSDTISVLSELSSSGVGDELLKMHDELQRVLFDQTLFSSAGYMGLYDFSVTIPEQNMGRPNPFNIIGRD